MRKKVVLPTEVPPVEPSLLAFGITLYAAALVPLTYGRFARGAGLAYLGTTAWGTGIGWTWGLVFVAATVAALGLLAVGLGVRLFGAFVRTRPVRA